MSVVRSTASFTHQLTSKAASEITDATKVYFRIDDAQLGLEAALAYSMSLEEVSKYATVYYSQGDDYVVEASGTAATDNAAVAAAVAALNAAGGGTLRLGTGVEMTGAHTFTAPISLRGLQSNTVIKSTHDFMFTWAQTTFPQAPSASHYDISAVAGDEYFTVVGNSFVPAVGDTVILYSEDSISGARPHNLGANNYPGTIHTVVRWEDPVAWLDGRIPYTLSTNAKAWRTTSILNNVVVADLSFEHTGTTQVTDAFALRFYGCRNATLENLHAPQAGAGAILFKYCQDCHVRGLTLENTDNDKFSYAIDAAFTNGLLVSDFAIGGHRHALGTSAYMYSGNDRYGCPQNIIFRHGLVRGFTCLDDTTRIATKTHTEGYGVLFDDITYDVGSERSSVDVAGVAIAPKTTWKDCVFRGQRVGTAVGGIGVRLIAPDCIVKDCTFESLYKGVVVDYNEASTDTYASGSIVKDNIIRNISGAGVILSSDATDVIVSGNTFVDTGNYATGSSKSCIHIDGGDGHRIHHNDMTKSANDYSVDINTLAAADIEMAGNVCYGYGSGVVGFDGTNAAAAESAHAGDNYTDA